MEDRHWLLWDGDCGFCRRTAAWVKQRDKRGRFRAIAYQDAPAPPMTPALYAACAQAVHVVRQDGRILRGGRAALFVIAQFGGGWTLAARLLRLPPFVWAVEAAYRVVAAHRDFFARFLFTKERP